MVVAQLSARRLVDLVSDYPDTRPAYRSLANAIRGVLVDGRVTHETRLPSERELSIALGVSRTTVTRAYGELVASGWASARRGSGTTLILRGLDHTGGSQLVAPEVEDGVINLMIAAPPAPPGTMDAVERAVALLPSRLAGHGYRMTGEPLLREQIAAHYDDRGLATDPEQIIVTPGALAATAVIVRMLIGRGDRAIMETPSYTNSVATLRAGGTRVVGLPVTTEGWDAEAFEATIRQTAPRFALLIPDFQNPTGALMDTATRDQFGAVLARTRTTGVADETMADLAIDPLTMPPPFAASNPDVITVGSTSKAFWGGFRIGWLRVPMAVRDRVVQARTSLDLGCSLADQLIAYEMFAHREALLDERRSALRESRDVLVAELRRLLPDWEFTTPRGGMTLWARMPEPVSSAVVLAAERHGLLLASGGQFGVDQDLRHYIRLPFALPVDVMREGVARLARAYAEAIAEPTLVRERAGSFIA
ncbi:MocR-like transcription factor YczR [Solicola gregarius]|uniref:PLP-dependent aminotransferase family protein n=1 Tax=Solicola gregarius TaxID=2908642 RepID=A0AA46YLP6_9ACTN|nr:PLP-dependent aminotransferase family protein [Solicola gregarius]UYM05804.1 PLP-dependent aminotransferase family protein [Solicola gregarius]